MTARADPQTSPRVELDVHVGRYEVESELSHGGMGVVYRARERATSRVVALKRLKPECASNPQIRALFEGEYRTLGQLQHPRILQVYGYGVDGIGPYFAMELLDGRDLSEIAPIPYREACRHLRDVASSLALLHARRLVYRDVSPRNVRLTRDGRAKLIDFGAVVPFGVTDRIVGTPATIAPEAWRGEPLDATTDLYALGALAYAALTGRLPYALKSIDDLPAALAGPLPEPPSTYAPSVPLALDELVLSLLSRDRLARPTSAAEVIERLNAIAELESESPGAVAHAYLVNPPLIGRERELGQLRRAITLALSGKAGTALLEGEGGTGRSRLLDEIGIEAQLRGATVLRASGEADRAPFGVMKRLGNELLVAQPAVARQTAQGAVELGELFPELRATIPNRAQRSGDLAEEHTRLQAALVRWFLAAASQCPLVLLVDDAHAADESSLSVLSKLANDATKQQVAVIVARRSDEEGRANGALNLKGRRIRVRSLTAEDTHRLAEAVFGKVEHAGRLGQRLHDRTDGNPLQCLELVRQLIAEKVVSYQNGTWNVPAELRDTSLPTGMHQLYERRVTTLSEGARRLAGLLSVESRPFSESEAAALSETTEEQVTNVLEELVSSGILLTAGNDFRFSHNTLRTFLYQGLPAPERSQAHARAGHFLLAPGDADAARRFEAGWHLIRGGEQTRGAELLAVTSMSMLRTLDGTRHAAPGLEAALEIFDREGRSEYAKFALLYGLMVAGWFIDRQYAAAYGDRALRTALQLSGLEHARRLAKVIGVRPALAAGLAAATLQHKLNEKHYLGHKREPPNMLTTFKRLFTIYGVCIGVAASCVNAEALEEYLRIAALMQHFGKNHPLGIIYDYARFYAFATQDKFSDAEQIGERIYEWLGTPAAIKALTKPVALSQQAGILAGLCAFAAPYAGDTAMKYANELEQLGVSGFEFNVSNTRCAYHMYRGAVHEAREHRDAMERHAIQGGSTWQTSLALPLLLGPALILTGDVVGIQQAADELARTSNVPSVAFAEATLRAACHVARGEPALAEKLLAKDSANLTTHKHPYCGVAVATYARALIALGRAEESARICELYLAAISSSGDRHYATVYVQITLALAEATLGDTKEAERRLRNLFSALETNGGPLMVALIHEARARVAVLDHDERRYAEHAGAMERAARSTRNPSVIAQWQRVTHFARRVLHREARRKRAPGSVAPPNTSGVLGAAVMFSDARQALAFAIERTGANAGALYAGAPPDATIVATQPEDWAAPPPDQQEMVGVAENVLRTDDFLTALQTVVDVTANEPGKTREPEIRCHPLLVPRGETWKCVGVLALSYSGPAPALEFDVMEPLAQFVVSGASPLGAKSTGERSAETSSVAKSDEQTA